MKTILLFIMIFFIVSAIGVRAEINDEIQQTALLIAQTIPYDILYYNCWDYATDLKIELAKEGYSSRIIHGLYGWMPHVWLEVNGTWIEATNGYVITDRTDYRFGYYSYIKYNPFKKRWKEKFRWD